MELVGYYCLSCATLHFFPENSTDPRRVPVLLSHTLLSADQSGLVISIKGRGLSVLMLSDVTQI
uniref:Uncharacterized protein n=1 Tax=Anguilla anguilla TaxID=7936 RepID=A0A0E9WES1_ANGAN